MKTTFEVEVKNIKVGDYHFGFDYTVVKDGEELKEDYHSGSHTWIRQKDDFKSLLEMGYAVELALQSVF